MNLKNLATRLDVIPAAGILSISGIAPSSSVAFKVVAHLIAILDQPGPADNELVAALAPLKPIECGLALTQPGDVVRYYLQTTDPRDILYFEKAYRWAVSRGIIVDAETADKAPCKKTSDQVFQEQMLAAVERSSSNTGLSFVDYKLLGFTPATIRDLLGIPDAALRFLLNDLLPFLRFLLEPSQTNPLNYINNVFRALFGVDSAGEGIEKIKRLSDSELQVARELIEAAQDQYHFARRPMGDAYYPKNHRLRNYSTDPRGQAAERWSRMCGGSGHSGILGVFAYFGFENLAKIPKAHRATVLKHFHRVMRGPGANDAVLLANPFTNDPEKIAALPLGAVVMRLYGIPNPARDVEAYENFFAEATVDLLEGWTWRTEGGSGEGVREAPTRLRDLGTVPLAVLAELNLMSFRILRQLLATYTVEEILEMPLEKLAWIRRIHTVDIHQVKRVPWGTGFHDGKIGFELSRGNCDQCFADLKLRAFVNRVAEWVEGRSHRNDFEDHVDAVQNLFVWLDKNHQWPEVAQLTEAQQDFLLQCYLWDRGEQLQAMGGVVALREAGELGPAHVTWLQELRSYRGLDTLPLKIICGLPEWCLVAGRLNTRGSGAPVLMSVPPILEQFLIDLDPKQLINNINAPFPSNPNLRTMVEASRAGKDLCKQLRAQNDLRYLGPKLAIILEGVGDVLARPEIQALYDSRDNSPPRPLDSEAAMQWAFCNLGLRFFLQKGSGAPPPREEIEFGLRVLIYAFLVASELDWLIAVSSLDGEQRSILGTQIYQMTASGITDFQTRSCSEPRVTL